AIQIISRASRIGLSIRVKDLFNHSTVQALAVVAKRTDRAHNMMTERADSTPLLSPIQHEFFQRSNVALNHFNQSVMLDLPSGLTLLDIKQIFEVIFAHHEALRTWFEKV